MTQQPLFALIADVWCVYDPTHTVNGYSSPWCVPDAPGGAAWFGSLEGVRAWRERQNKENGR